MNKALLKNTAGSINKVQVTKAQLAEIHHVFYAGKVDTVTSS